MKKIVLILIVVLSLLHCVSAQHKREMRAAWVATVANIGVAKH